MKNSTTNGDISADASALDTVCGCDMTMLLDVNSLIETLMRRRRADNCPLGQSVLRLSRDKFTKKNPGNYRQG